MQQWASAHRGRRIRPEAFPYHHLRHTGLSLLAENGAGMAELQARAGHATAGIAMRYQHARAERDRALADRLGEVAQTGVLRT